MVVNEFFLSVSKLDRNVPMVNSLEVSPFLMFMFSLACALERSPAVRAKRKCAGQRAARRAPGQEPAASYCDSLDAKGDRAWPFSPPPRGTQVEAAQEFFGSAPAVR